MIWIISAIVLGIILGILGYYFSKTAFVIFVAVILVVISLLIMSDFEHYRHYEDMYIASRHKGSIYFLSYLIKRFELLSDHHLMVVLSFTFSFFAARIMTWLLTALGFVPKIAVQAGDYLEGTMEAYDYLAADYDRMHHYYW